MTLDVLSSYLRAWSRHQVFFALPSYDAAARSGLSLPQAARLFDAACIEISPFLSRTPDPGMPDGCPVDLIVEDDSLVYRFPHRHPDPARRGEVNDGFLDPSALAGRLSPILDALKERVRLVVLRPAPLYGTETLRLSALLERLDRLLAQLPVRSSHPLGAPSGPGPYHYGLEPPGPLCLHPEYFACLRARGVTPLAAEGDGLLRTLPPLAEQLTVPGVLAPPACVLWSQAHSGVPGLMRPRPDRVCRWQAWCDAVRRCLARGIRLHLFVDDESDPLGALAFLMEMLNDDLARQSIIRRRAA